MVSFDLKPLEHGSLAQQAAEALLGHIVATGLKPGASLPAVATLAESLGVSRPVVREALNALRALGIVEIANGKKATIRDLDNGVLRIYFDRALQVVDDSVREVMDVRAGIEIRSAALAARNRSADDLALMREHSAAMRTAIGDAERFSRHDSSLHLAISQASGNRLIFHIVESLQSALRHASYQGVRAIAEPETLNRIVEEHDRLVEAIERRDEVAAADLMHDHIAAAMRRTGM